MGEKLVIVGGGPAATNAMETIRRFNSTAEITLVCDEPAHSRMALPYWLSGQIPKAQLILGMPTTLNACGSWLGSVSESTKWTTDSVPCRWPRARRSRSTNYCSLRAPLPPRCRFPVRICPAFNTSGRAPDRECPAGHGPFAIASRGHDWCRVHRFDRPQCNAQARLESDRHRARDAECCRACSTRRRPSSRKAG